MIWRFSKSICRALCATGLMLIQLTGQSFAAEQAKGTYLLGSGGPQAGMMPPVAGVFLTDFIYVYSGSADANLEIPIGGNLVADIDADIVIGAPLAMWVPETTVLGGRLGILGVLPIGSVGVDVGVVVLGPGGLPVGNAGVSQSRVSVGDPQAGALIGWNSGNFHWNAGFMANIPIGDYEKGRLDNLAFNRWSVDLNGGITWLDPAMGLELSTKLGVTFNGENSATDYKTGEEFHIEFAALQHFSQEIQFGLAGYHYQQISGDSGSGAVAGEFKGRVTAFGPHLGVNFLIGQLPVSASGRFYVEFDTKNRLEGTGGYIFASMPLYVATTNQ